MEGGRGRGPREGAEGALEPFYELDTAAGPGAEEPDPEVIDIMMDSGKAWMQVGYLDKAEWPKQMREGFPKADFGGMVDDTTLGVVYDLASDPIQGEVGHRLRKT